MHIVLNFACVAIIDENADTEKGAILMLNSLRDSFESVYNPFYLHIHMLNIFSRFL